MATYEEIAAAMMKSHMNNEFVWEGEIITLTGRYACPIVSPGTSANTSNIVASLHVEIKTCDKDAPKACWVKFSDLKIVKSVHKSISI